MDLFFVYCFSFKPYKEGSMYLLMFLYYDGWYCEPQGESVLYNSCIFFPVYIIYLFSKKAVLLNIEKSNPSHQNRN